MNTYEVPKKRWRLVAPEGIERTTPGAVISYHSSKKAAGTIADRYNPLPNLEVFATGRGWVPEEWK